MTVSDNRVIAVIQILTQHADTHPDVLGEACRDATLLLAMLREDLVEARTGYHALDRNWQSVHDAAMGAIRQALGMPDATVFELCAAILKLKDGSR